MVRDLVGPDNAFRLAFAANHFPFIASADSLRGQHEIAEMTTDTPAPPTRTTVSKSQVTRVRAQGRPSFPISRMTVLKIFAFIGALVVFMLAMYGLGVLGLYDLNYMMTKLLRPLYLGATSTLVLVGIVIPIGFSAGFLFGWGRTSHSWLVRSVSGWYVEFFRSMPPVVLVAFSSLIATVVILRTPFLSDRISDPASFALSIAVLALALHSGSYQAEIIRAGIQSVPAGQREAAEAIGLSKGRTMANVILPQMFRVSLPALGNEFASVIKDTSILSVVGVLELMFMGNNLTSRLITSPGANLENINLIWISIAMVYFPMTFAVSRSLQMIERKFRVPGLEAAQL